MTEVRIKGKVYWADVAAGYQRAIRSFDDLVTPVLMRQGYSQLGMTHILFLVNIGDGPKRIADLIRDQRYPGSNASYALSHLVDAGLVVRRCDDKDARVRIVELTDKGQELLKAIRQVSDGNSTEIQAALATLSAFERHVGVANVPAE